MGKLAKLKQLRELVSKFRNNISQYTDQNYKEQRLRMDFVDDLFELLDWDISNKEGAIEEFRDVVIEDNLEISGTQKYPDYTFRIGNEPVFFVETKKPAVNIKDSIDPAHQVRRYGYSAKRKISILTDFEEFAIYDTRVKPGKNDHASVARLFYCNFEEYEKNWDFLSGLLAKDAVKQGSINNYVGKGTKRGTSEVDKDFLRLIEAWRAALARNIAKNNKRADLDGINLAVQKIIDRIIFLRICEEKGIEQFENLRTIGGDKAVYEKLALYFDKANKKYNSELFKPDDFVNDLEIDDEVLRDIIKAIYQPECPYAFSVLPVEILGNIYEQFLGKTIHLTETHQARIEEKPEVRKAGGVYYTPKYIVDYIVKNTVGEKIKGLSPKEIAKINILDPACGSGSFLLGAYTYLLNYHLAYYTSKEELSKAIKHEKVYLAGKNSYKLTIKEKQNILLNNIFGVDIDAQAVEVTKLSLMLKLLEGESDESAGMLFKYSETKLLPTLSNNIKCGNSLIGPDFYKGKNLSLFGDEDMKKINAFDWEKEYPEIFKAGGFDCVIGNPPYGATLSDSEATFIRNQFVTASKELDSYVLFIERAVALTKTGGRIAMIVPTGWYSGPKFSALRRYVATKTDPIDLINLPYDIFDAWVDTTIFTLVKRVNPLVWPRKDSFVTNIMTFPKRHNISNIEEFYQNVTQSKFSEWFLSGNDNFLSYADTASMRIIKKILDAGKPLGEMADVQRGVTPFSLSTRPTHATSRIAFNGTVRRYQFDKGEKCFIRFDNSLAEPKPERYFIGSRILLRELISRQLQLQAVKVDEDFVTNKSMQSILPIKGGPDLNYLLGVLNSKLMSWLFLRKSNIAQRDDFPKIILKETRSLPIRPINLSNPLEKSLNDGVVSLVGQMLETQKKVHSAKSEGDQKHYQQKIEILDKQIDELVYELYGLTKEEIAVVEAHE